MSTVSSIETIKSMLTPVFMRYDIKGAILFGSFAKGSATEHSDVDLLVESNLRGLRFVGFSEAVREAVGRPVDIFDNNGFTTKILAASFKNSQQVQALCEYGVGAATIAPDVIEGLVKNASVSSAVAAFTADFEKLCGQGKTMLDC